MSSGKLNYRLRKGMLVEEEHKPTLLFIKNNLKKTGKLPADKKIYTSIARDHIVGERKPNYYPTLKKAGL